MLRHMTDEERRFASDNHGLVLAFLWEKELPVSSYYDIVVFGFLKAVQVYCSLKKKSRFQFSTIAWKWMESELSRYRKYLSSPRRCAPVVSLDDVIDDAHGLCWMDIVSVQDSAMRDLEMELLLHDLAAELPPREMRIIRMKAGGLRMNEIAKAEHLTFRAINELLAGVYPVVVRVLRG